MPVSQSQGQQRQAARDQSLLRPVRTPDLELHSAFQAQRVLGNRALTRSAAPPAPPPAVASGIQRLVQRSAALVVQPKLTLGPVDDAYEREADQMASDVMQRISEPTVQRAEDEEEELQASRAPGGPEALDPALESSIQRARTGGSPLPAGVRSTMESSFGADFGGVRVHTGAQPTQLNSQLQARAFTTGRDIFFRDGEYDPGSRAGQQLLAHELTHVVQQGAAGSVRAKRLAAGQHQRRMALDSLFFAG